LLRSASLIDPFLICPPVINFDAAAMPAAPTATAIVHASAIRRISFMPCLLPSDVWDVPHAIQVQRRGAQVC
jgi:hypothetical protein